MLLEQVADRAAARGDQNGCVSRCGAASSIARREMFRGELDDPVRAVLIFSRKLGDALAPSGDLTDAEGVLREALDLAGPSGPDRARVLGSLAFTRAAATRTIEATVYLREALELARRRTLQDLVDSLERMRREWTASAELPSRESLDMPSQSCGDCSPRTTPANGCRAPDDGRPPFIARWDLDKTYLRTDFDTLRDLVRTAIERPDQKRTVPGAAALLRELGRAGVETHILSRQPRAAPLAHRAEAAPRRRALGVAHAQAQPPEHAAPALPRAAGAARLQAAGAPPGRCELSAQRDATASSCTRCCSATTPRPTPSSTRSTPTSARARSTRDVLADVMRRGGAYDDTIRDAIRFASYVEKGPVVERILIHLERQSSPFGASSRVFGSRAWCRSTTT
jgi:hypothetical protein